MLVKFCLGANSLKLSELFVFADTNLVGVYLRADCEGEPSIDLRYSCHIRFKFLKYEKFLFTVFKNFDKIEPDPFD